MRILLVKDLIRYQYPDLLVWDNLEPPNSCKNAYYTLCYLHGKSTIFKKRIIHKSGISMGFRWTVASWLINIDWCLLGSQFWILVSQIFAPSLRSNPYFQWSTSSFRAEISFSWWNPAKLSKIVENDHKFSKSPDVSSVFLCFPKVFPSFSMVFPNVFCPGVTSERFQRLGRHIAHGAQNTQKGTRSGRSLGELWRVTSVIVVIIPLLDMPDIMIHHY